MNVAVQIARISLAAETGASRRAERIARVEIHRDLADAAPCWLRMEAEGALATPYQRYDFLQLWQHHVGAASSVTPFVVVGYDLADKPLMLLPFGTSTTGPLRILQFLGGKHANINFGVWNRDYAAAIGDTEANALLRRIAEAAPDIDLVALHRQPRVWNDITNPFLHLPHQASPSESCCSDLQLGGTTVSRSMRKQLRSKDRKLAELSGFRYFRASTTDEVERLLTWFFTVKAIHLKSRGLANAFNHPGIEDFVRDLCTRGLADGRPVAEIYALEGGGEPLAVFAGTGDGERFSLMFNTYTLGDNARLSPGLVLLTHMFTELAARGFTSIDLGAGDARYKRGFCRQDEPLFDSFLPLTAIGRLAAAGARSATSLKRGIKNSPRLWSAFQAVRRHVNGLRPA